MSAPTMPDTAPPSSSSHFALTQKLLWLVGGLAGFLLFDSLIEPEISPFHILQILRGEIREPREIIIFLTAMARLQGFLLASTITLVGIAIPLAANNYTPRLINLFIRDRINWSVFGLLVLSNMLSHWTLLAAAGKTLPMINVGLCTVLGLVSVLLIIPYAFYVMRSLEPENILLRIEAEIVEDLATATVPDPDDSVDGLRNHLIQSIKYVSNIALRSIDRHDRDTALFALEALCRVFAKYFECKPRLPREWFRVRHDDFLNKPPEVLEQIEESGTIFEVELLEECALMLSVSIDRFREVVRNVGVTTRQIGQLAVAHDEEQALEAVRVYFNSFIRAAISRRSPDAIYMLVFQYRLFAEQTLEKNPGNATKVAFYLDYYAHQAVRSGIVFVANLIAYDLAYLTILAWDQGSPCRGRLFEIYVDFDRNETLKDFPGVIKSHLKLMIYMAHQGHEAELARLETELGRVDDELIRRAVVEIDAIDSPYYWEVTDRRLHLDFVEEEMQPAWTTIKERLAARFATA